MASQYLIHPVRGTRIKIGSKSHLKLISDGILDRDTLEATCQPIVPDVRSTRPRVVLEFTAKNTHIINLAEIAKALAVDPLRIVSYMRSEYETMRIVLHRDSIRLIVDGREPFVDRVIDDFVVNQLGTRGWNE